MEQSVELGALAHIGLAHDGSRDALLDGISRLERVGKGIDAALYLFCKSSQFAAVGKLQFLVVTEIQLQLQQRSDMQKLFT